MSSVVKTGLIAGLLALSACGENSVFEDPSAKKGYRLVGIYDSTALRGTEIPGQTEESPGYGFRWVAPQEMIDSCGPTKTPDGLGIFEAEVLATGRMPTVALIVERMGGVPTLDNDRLRVAISGKEEGQQIFLQPALEPRYLEINIDATEEVNDFYLTQVRDQLQRFLCLEHKTGRAWLGGTAEQVSQAVLLRNAAFRQRDRRFFGGQGTPVAPLLGPPQACIRANPRLQSPSRIKNKGGKSTALIPADVFSSTLAKCDPGYRAGEGYFNTTQMDMVLSDTRIGNTERMKRTWSSVQVNLTPGEERAPNVEVLFEGREHAVALGQTPQQISLLDNMPLEYMIDEESGKRGLVDIVSNLPYRYPTLGDEADPERYSVLLIPNWQIVEAVKRLNSISPDSPAPTNPDIEERVEDGVGWLLAHPERLMVMVPEDAATFGDLKGDEEMAKASWVNIAGPLSLKIPFINLDLKAWGYATGLLAGRSPIALPGVQVPSWDQVAMAQRAPQHGLFIGSCLLLFVFFGVGSVRLRELWLRVPEERVEFWPGFVAEGEAEEDDVGDLSGAGEDE